MDEEAVQKGKVLELCQHFAERAEHSKILPKIKYGSQELVDCINRALDVAPADHLSVLVYGETGVGKEGIARLIHEQSVRKNKELVLVDCTTLEENLMLSDLFGHARGAFTGADKDKSGFFEIADGGSIFLDEIGELSKTVQARLLRVLQEGTFNRLGETRVRRIDVRVIAATNRNLEEEIKEGNFRKDLYYRLAKFLIRIPSLRERPDDINVLAYYFKDRSLSDKTRPVAFSKKALQVLNKYSWPGNVRELENAIERALVNCKNGEIWPEHLELASLDSSLCIPHGEKVAGLISAERKIGELERQLEKEQQSISETSFEQIKKIRQEKSEIYSEPPEIERQFLELGEAKAFKEKFPGITLGVTTLKEAIRYVEIGHIRLYVNAAGGDIGKAWRLYHKELRTNNSAVFKKRIIEADAELMNIRFPDIRVKLGVNCQDTISEIRQKYTTLVYRFFLGDSHKTASVLGMAYKSYYNLQLSLRLKERASIILEQDRRLYDRRKKSQKMRFDSVADTTAGTQANVSYEVSQKRSEQENGFELEIADIKEKLEKSHEEFRGIKNANSTLIEEKEFLDLQVAELEGNLSQVRAQLEMMQDEKKKLDEQLSEARTKITSSERMQAEIDHLLGKNQQLQKAKSEAEELYLATLNEKEQLNCQSDEQRVAYESMLEEEKLGRKTDQAQIATLSREAERARNSLSEIEKLKRAVSLKAAELKKAEQKIAELNRKLAEATRKKSIWGRI